MRKTNADDTTTGTALANTTGLDFTLTANTSYTFEYFILFQSAAANTGMGLAVNGPAAPTVVSYTIQTPQAADANNAMFNGWGTYLDDPVQAASVQTANTTYVARINGVIRTGASGGTLLPRFRSELNGTAVRVMTYSWGALHTG
ncbi:MAG: hypothetical protein ACRDNH_05315 [Gaiellaceae bacterium]